MQSERNVTGLPKHRFIGCDTYEDIQLITGRLRLIKTNVLLSQAEISSMLLYYRSLIGNQSNKGLSSIVITQSQCVAEMVTIFLGYDTFGLTI